MKRIIVGLVFTLLAAGAGYYGYHQYHYISTNNATIECKTTMLSAQIGGVIESVNIEENQTVKAGQILAKIRPVSYQNALNLARAESASLAAQQKVAKLNAARSKALFAEGAETQEKRDLAEAQYKALTEKLKASEFNIKQAEENFSHTDITAPADGRIAKKSFELGMAVNPGQPIIGFVIGDDRWVIANFKETELDGLKIGQSATVKIDAYPDKKLTGIVESISPSTGASFSLLPPDNAVGNFTKVVQRVPVKIKLLHLTAADIQLLQAGLSVEVSVKRR